MLRVALQDSFHLHVDLYCVQMLPCTWRHYRKSASASAAGQLRWQTSARRLVEDMWEVETARFEEAVAWLRHFNLWDCFLQLAALQRRAFLRNVRWLPGVKAKAIAAQLAKAAQLVV